MNRAAILVFCVVSNAILGVYGEEKRNTNALSSDLRQSTIQAAEKGNANAILELGRSGNSSVIPTLKELRTRETNKAMGSVSSRAQMALARLGDAEAMSEILTEMKSDDPTVQDNAIRKLVYVSNDEAIRNLIALLDDAGPRKMKEYDPEQRGPHGEIPQGKIIYLPINVMAMKALAEIVPNPVIASGKEPTQEEIQLWLEWWKLNRNKNRGQILNIQH